MRWTAPGDLKSERWARSNRNARRDKIGIAGRLHRNPHAALVHGVLCRYEAPAAHVVPIDEPEHHRTRVAAALSCSIVSTQPVVPFSRPRGVVPAHRPSPRIRGVISRSSSKRCASSGCRAGIADHKPPSAPPQPGPSGTAYHHPAVPPARSPKFGSSNGKNPNDGLRPKLCAEQWPARSVVVMNKGV